MNRIMKRNQYIGALKACLSARDDFGNLTYHRDYATAEEYLILSDVIGQVYILDITGHSEAKVWHALAQIECGQIPANAITDRSEMMRIAKQIR